MQSLTTNNSWCRLFEKIDIIPMKSKQREQAKSWIVFF